MVDELPCHMEGPPAANLKFALNYDQRPFVWIIVILILLTNCSDPVYCKVFFNFANYTYIHSIQLYLLNFPYHNRDRIMVTLSCLIVEAGIYSQVNSSVPKSASSKMIDFYFFYFIAKLFLICIFHTLNYLWIEKCERNRKEEENENSLMNVNDVTKVGTNNNEKSPSIPVDRIYIRILILYLHLLDSQFNFENKNSSDIIFISNKKALLKLNLILNTCQCHLESLSHLKII